MLAGSGHGAASLTCPESTVSGSRICTGTSCNGAAETTGGGGAGCDATVRTAALGAVAGTGTGVATGAGIEASITGSGATEIVGASATATDGSNPQSCWRSGPTRGTHSTRSPTSIRAKTQPALSTYSTPSKPAGGSSAGTASWAEAGAAPKANVIATANAARFITRYCMQTPQGCCVKPDRSIGSSKGRPTGHFVPYMRSPASPRPGTI